MRLFATCSLFLAALVFLTGASTARVPPLQSWAGKYPSDKIEGYTLLSHPVIRRAVARAVLNPLVQRRVLEEATQNRVQQRGRLLIASMCLSHACNSENWIIAVLLPGGPAAVCYHDNELTGATGRWFIGGSARYQSTDACSAGQDSADVPSAVVTSMVTDAR